MLLRYTVPPDDMHRHDSVRPYSLDSDYAGVFVCGVALHHAVIGKHLHASCNDTR
jgi:hypothetical protein